MAVHDGKLALKKDSRSHRENSQIKYNTQHSHRNQKQNKTPLWKEKEKKKSSSLLPESSWRSPSSKWHPGPRNKNKQTKKQKTMGFQ